MAAMATTDRKAFLTRSAAAALAVSGGLLLLGCELLSGWSLTVIERMF